MRSDIGVWEVFSLWQAGMKYREIAYKLDIPSGTVKSRIWRARAKLRNQKEGAQNKPLVPPQM